MANNTKWIIGILGVGLAVGGIVYLVTRTRTSNGNGNGEISCTPGQTRENPSCPDETQTCNTTGTGWIGTCTGDGVSCSASITTPIIATTDGDNLDLSFGIRNNTSSIRQIPRIHLIVGVNNWPDRHFVIGEDIGEFVPDGYLGDTPILGPNEVRYMHYIMDPTNPMPWINNIYSVTIRFENSDGGLICPGAERTVEVIRV